jgi:hypothetical protein
MTERILVLAITASFFLPACQNPAQTDREGSQTPPTSATQTVGPAEIAFTVAENYFVNNTVTRLENPKIETAEKFQEVFGMATTMGQGGKPTEIDFAKQYVIAVILPETDLETKVEPVILQKNAEGKIVLAYKVTVGPKSTYTRVPNFAIIVDKADNGDVLLQEVKP